MRIIDKKIVVERNEKIKEYYFDDLGGLKGMASILREYENLGYVIKYIDVPVDSDHSDPYLNPTMFNSIDEFLENIFLFPSDTNFLLSGLGKDINDYVITMNGENNLMRVYPPKKKDEIKKMGSK